MDFALQKALQGGLTHQESWGTGLIEIYEALANDFAYTDPNRLLAFLDNHDMDRAFTQYKENRITGDGLGYAIDPSPCTATLLRYRNLDGKHRKTT